MTIKKVLAGALLAVFAFSASADAAYTWSTSLKLGSRGESVRDLQKFLNSCADTQVSMSGAGAPGMETAYFGPATKAAVVKWQTARGVSPQSGLFGPLSRAKAAELQMSANPCAGGAVVNPSLPAGCTSTSGFSPITGQSCAGGVTTPQSGPVNAMLASSTPAAGYIVNNQATAGLLDIQFSGNGVVNSVTLTRSGISDQNTLTNVYLYDGATRLTDGYSFNSNSQIVMNNLNLMVSGTKVISVKADASGTASSNSTIAIALTSFTAGTSANMVNIQGNMMNLATGSSLANATISANTVSSANVNAGISAYTFWSAPIQVNTRALALKSAAFRMIGSAPADALSNIRLFVNGVDTGKTAMVMPIQGTNYAVFDLMSSPLSLPTGSHTVSVRANIEKGSNRTVQFSLQQAADLMIMDPQVGVNVAISGTIPNPAGTITINTGSLTISQDPTFQSMTNITGGASNVVVAKYKFRAYGEDVKVNSLVIDPEFTVAPTASPACTNGTNCSLDDVTLYFNGSQVGTQQDWNGVTVTDLTYNLGSQMIVPAGMDSFLEIRANVRTSGGANYTAGTVRANLVAGSSNAQGQSSYNTVSTTGINGTSLAIQTGLLAVSKNTGYANQSVTPNTANAKIGSFSLQNQSSSESVRVTSLSVRMTTNGTTDMTGVTTPALTNFAALKTSETSGSGANPVQPQTTNVFSVDFTLAPGAAKTIDLFADTNSTTGSSFVAELTVTSIGVSSNVSATSSAIDGQTITLASGTVANPTLVTASATQAQYIAAGMGGAADGTKATFNFVSTGGSATISELKFTVTGTDTVTSVKVGSSTANVVGTVAYLTGLNLVVPNGGSGLTQDVFISYSEVGTNGIAPGTTSAVALTEVKYTSGGTTTVINPSISAPTMILVGSKPTVSVSTTQATGLNISGESKIGEVTVAADAKGNIKVNTLVFTVSSSGFSTAPTAIGSPRLADGNTTITGTVCTPASLVVTCTLDTNANPATGFDGYTIAAGSSKTFTLFGTLTGAAAVGSGTPIVSSSVGASTFNWDDTSTNGGAGSFNLSGSSIYNFPTNSFSIKQ